MQDMARRIAQNSRDAKIDVDVDDYVSKFKPFMMDVVYEWCKGATFSQICKMTDLFEGAFLLHLF
jgi:ATP-dependent RNA helicase DOB1